MIPGSGNRQSPVAFCHQAKQDNRWYFFQILVNIVPFIYHNRLGVAWPKITSFLQDVRSSDIGSHLPIGIAGFCWGGPPTFRLASDRADTRTRDGKRSLADAFFTAHPSNLSIPADIQQVKTNISVAIGDDDVALSLEKAKKIESLLANLPGVDSEMVVYPGAKHGFAVRADKEGNPKSASQAEEAEKQAIGML